MSAIASPAIRKAACVRVDVTPLDGVSPSAEALSRRFCDRRVTAGVFSSFHSLEDSRWRGVWIKLASTSCFRLVVMLLASRNVLHHHREIAAVMITYGAFLSGILALAWIVA